MKNDGAYPIACYPAVDIVLQAIKANLQGNVTKITEHNAWDHNTDFHQDWG